MTELYYNVSCMDAKTGEDVGETHVYGPVSHLSLLKKQIENNINSKSPGIRAQAIPFNYDTQSISTLSPIKTFPIKTKNRIGFERLNKKEIVTMPYLYQVHPETFQLTSTYGTITVANQKWSRSEVLLHQAIVKSLHARIEIGKMYTHPNFIWATPVILVTNYHSQNIIIGSFLSLKKERS